MIQILKPVAAPAVLRTRGERARKALCAKGRARVKRSDFIAAVYAHREVKELNDRPALIEDRREHLVMMMALETLVCLGADPDAQACLDKYRTGTARYASMSRDHQGR